MGTTPSAASLLGFGVLLVTLALEVAARHRCGPATAQQAVTAAMRTAPGRVLVLTAWLWSGVHFLAR